ncbi:MAG: serine/threonine-protein kinase [Deltaproteobacteria bacterium]|jgi:serine/threonine protein kinase|nr:serine/threonine-protein kinase [Deltaproteobacteria bacterium]
MTKTDLIGKTVGGRFIIEQFVGEGGMGIVFKGRHKELNYEVAVKILKSEHASDASMVARFRREVRSTSMLQHKNLVVLYDSGQLDDGRLYLVTEFIQGKSMIEYMDEEDTLSTSKALKMMIQIADGMAAAHRHTIMHRDLKPENILILDTDEGKLIKILDFGLAKMVESNNPEDKITMTGEVFGTPTYMSPEQCLGGELDLTTDVYSFGIIAYEMLTGRPPFDDPNIVTIMLSHKNKTPMAPSEDFPEAGIPKEVDNLILKCLEKNPADRLLNGTELANELRKIQDIIIRNRSGAPADLEVERRIDSIQIQSVGSGSSLTSKEVYGMVLARLRKRLRRVCEILRDYQVMTPNLSVEIAHLSTAEDRLVTLKQQEASLINAISDKEKNIQNRTGQLRVAVQDLSYDRELLFKKLQINPDISINELISIFPYLDAASAPTNGQQLLHDISFQITALERSIDNSIKSSHKERKNLKRKLDSKKSLILQEEKKLALQVFNVVELLLNQADNLNNISPLKNEMQALKIFYEEAKNMR